MIVRSAEARVVAAARGLLVLPLNLTRSNDQWISNGFDSLSKRIIGRANYANLRRSRISSTYVRSMLIRTAVYEVLQIFIEALSPPESTVLDPSCLRGVKSVFRKKLFQ